MAQVLPKVLPTLISLIQAFLIQALLVKILLVQTPMIKVPPAKVSLAEFSPTHAFLVYKLLTSVLLVSNKPGCWLLEKYPEQVNLEYYNIVYLSENTIKPYKSSLVNHLVNYKLIYKPMQQRYLTKNKDNKVYLMDWYYQKSRL